jgi:hypothetical protein
MTLNRKYNEAMEHIEVTPEMRSRILDNIENMDFAEKKQAEIVRFPNIKRYAMLAACFAVMLVGALTLPNLLDISNEPPVIENNNIVEVSSVEELSKTVGFEVVELGNLPFEPESVVYTAYWAEVAEIVYTSGEQTAVFRKGIGSDDVSGDYNSYELTSEISVNNIKATLKGDGGIYTLAIWTDSEFAYSLSLSEGVGEAEWISIFKTMVD